MLRAALFQTLDGFNPHSAWGFTKTGVTLLPEVTQYLYRVYCHNLLRGYSLHRCFSFLFSSFYPCRLIRKTMGRVSPSKVLNQDTVLLRLGFISLQMRSARSPWILVSGAPLSERSRSSWWVVKLPMSKKRDRVKNLCSELGGSGWGGRNRRRGYKRRELTLEEIDSSL